MKSLFFGIISLVLISQSAFAQKTASTVLNFDRYVNFRVFFDGMSLRAYKPVSTNGEKRALLVRAKYNENYQFDGWEKLSAGTLTYEVSKNMLVVKNSRPFYQLTFDISTCTKADDYKMELVEMEVSKTSTDLKVLRNLASWMNEKDSHRAPNFNFECPDYRNLGE